MYVHIINGNVNSVSSFQQSFLNVKLWVKALQRANSEERLAVLLVGNKCDLTRQRVVEYRTAKVTLCL